VQLAAVQFWHTCSSRPEHIAQHAAASASEHPVARILLNPLGLHAVCFPFERTPFRRLNMTWTKPEFIDWRFGFEITLYIANR
jgi:coenzyme PQQ precursor peptide PqqA